MSEPAQQPPALPNPRVAIDRYDFFGFFLPGLILTSILGVWLFHVHQLDLSWITTNIFTNDTEIYIIFVLLLILVSYILGQLIATCSFIVHDKILQGKILGYPYKSIIFDIHENKEFRRTDGANYYRSILTIGYLIILSYILRHMLDFLDTPIWLLLSVFFFFVCGLHLAEKTLRTYCPQSKPYRIVIAVSSKLSFVMSQPFYAGENFFRVIMDFDRALPKPTRDRFKKKFLERFGIDAREDAEADIYWLSYLYVMENSSFAKDMIYKSLILSALHRNMGTSFLISSIFLSLPFTGINQDTHFTYLSLSFYVFSIFLSVRYYSIFSGYYSKTIFRRFALMN